MRYHPAFFSHSLPRLSRLTLSHRHRRDTSLQLRFRAVVTSSLPVLSVLAADTFGLVQPRSLSRLWRGAAFERSADNLATAVHSISRSRRRCRLPWSTFPLAGSVFELKLSSGFSIRKSGDSFERLALSVQCSFGVSPTAVAFSVCPEGGDSPFHVSRSVGRSVTGVNAI